MPDCIINTLLPLVFKKPIHGLFETGRTTFTNRTTMISKNLTTQKLFDPESGNLLEMASSFRHNLLTLPVAAFPSRLAKNTGASAVKMEVCQA